MSDESKPPVPPRVVEAVLHRDKTSMGPMEIVGSTKHGSTTLIATAEDALRVGDILKTKAWLLNAREFVVVRKHDQPMKLAGVWYEVRTVAAPSARK